MELEEFKEIWEKDIIIAFDTSALIDIYFFSSETIVDILEKLEIIIEKTWIPNQVYIEFIRNHKEKHESAFAKHDKLKGDFTKSINLFKKEIENLFKHYKKYNLPKMDILKAEINDDSERILLNLEKYKKELKDEIEKHKALLKKDKIKEFLEKMRMDNKIGNKYIMPELLKIYEEGERRYKYKIPPGYEDLEKDKRDSTKTQKFGDLIIWKQIIDKCKKENKSLIFITNDKKEDWTEKNKEPRTELIEEFKYNCNENIDFYMLSFEKMYKYLSVIYNWNNIKAQIEIEADSFIFNYLRNEISKLKPEIEAKIDDIILFNITREIEDKYGLIIEKFGEQNITEFEIEKVYVEFNDDNEVYYSVLLTAKDYTSLEKENINFGDISIELEIEVSIFANINLVNGHEVIVDFYNIESCYLLSYQENIDDSELCYICKNARGEIMYEEGYVCEKCAQKFGICAYCGEAHKHEDFIGDMCIKCFEEKMEDD